MFRLYKIEFLTFLEENKVQSEDKIGMNLFVENMVDIFKSGLFIPIEGAFQSNYPRKVIINIETYYSIDVEPDYWIAFKAFKNSLQ